MDIRIPFLFILSAFTASIASAQYIYGVIPEPTTWDDAAAVCEADGASWLLDVEDAAENTVVVESLAAEGLDASWTSGGFSMTKYRFEWVSTSTELTYYNWAPGQPTQISGVRILMQEGLWATVDMTEMHPFICKSFEPTTAPPTTTDLPTTELPTTNSPPPPPTPFKCTAAGTFPNDTDCRKYYKCVLVSGTMYTYIYTCPAGSYFDAVKLKCLLGSCV